MSLARRILVQMPYLGSVKTEVWDPNIPKRIGPKFAWIIERTDSGYLVRNIQDGSFREIAASEIGDGKSFELPSTSEGPENRKMSLLPQRIMTAPFDGESQLIPGKGTMLAVFARIGPWILSTARVESGFIAAIRGHELFAIARKKNTYEIRVLVPGVRIQSPSQKIETKPGDVFEIPIEDMPSTLIRRGRRKWSFRYLAASPLLLDGLKGFPKVDSETLWLGFLTFLMLGSVVAVGAWVRSIPEAQPVIQNSIEKKSVLVSVKPPEPFIEKEKKIVPPKVVEMKSADDPVQTLRKRSDAPGPAPEKKSVGGLVAKKAPTPNLDLSKLKSALSRFSERTESGLVSDQAVRKNTPLSADQAFQSKAVGQVLDPIDPKMIRPDVQVSQVGGLPGADYTDLRSSAVTGKGGGGSYAQVSPGGGAVDEGLTKEEVDQVVQNHMSEIRQCHEGAPVQGRLSEGKLEIGFVISPQGRVSSARVSESSVQNPNLEECAVRKIKSWAFPNPTGGVSVKIAYPFFFKVLGR